MVRTGPESTRHELLKAAASEISERGYSGASFSAVAARLGLTKGAFAYHFPTKQALAVALMEEFEETFNEFLKDARLEYPDNDLYTILRAMGRLEAAFNEDPMVSAAFALMLDPKPPVDEVSAKFRWWLTQLQSCLANAEKSGQINPTVTLKEASEFIAVSLLGLTYLLHRSLGEARINNRVHLELLFTSIGVLDIRSVLDELFTPGGDYLASLEAGD